MHKTPKITTHTVDGEAVNVWHSDEGLSISFESGGWMKGTYDSVESAILGAKLDIMGCVEFYEMQERVNHFDKGNRLITKSDCEVILGEL